eukprot:scaffold107495_cov40-Attheya_sp.AAC.1
MSASARSSRSNPSSVNVDDPKAKWTLPDNVFVRIQSDAAVMRNSELIPYCSCYGLSRKVAYPDHFFCNGCERADQKELESIMLNKAKWMVNRNSTRYQCASRHQSWSAPTHLIATYRKTNTPCNLETVSSSSTTKKRKHPSSSIPVSSPHHQRIHNRVPSSNSNAFSPISRMSQVTPLTTRRTDSFASTAHHPIFESIYDERIRRLNNELVRLREIEWKYNAQTQQHSTTRLHADCSLSSTSRPRPKLAIQNSIKRTIEQNYEQYLPSTCGKAIAEAVWSDKFMDGIALSRLRELAQAESSIKEIAKKKPAEATRHFIESLPQQRAVGQKKH